jgi:hypothetical protein
MTGFELVIHTAGKVRDTVKPYESTDRTHAVTYKGIEETL